MIRFVFRFVGLWILAAGFVALVRDGTYAIAANAVDFTKLGTLNDDWTNIHGASLDAAEGAGRALCRACGLGGRVSLYPRLPPTWLVLGIIGSLFILIGRKKKPLIGYGRD